ncbi:unnamed protein product, partial [Ectocarpus sp. 8 AP-2014]
FLADLALHHHSIEAPAIAPARRTSLLLLSRHSHVKSSRQGPSHRVTPRQIIRFKEHHITSHHVKSSRQGTSIHVASRRVTQHHIMSHPHHATARARFAFVIAR